MSVVQKVVAQAKAPDGELDQIAHEATVLSQRATGLLPVERDARQAIESRMTELRLLSKQVEFAEATGLKMIPLEVMSWTSTHRVRKEDWRKSAVLLQLPKLALISVDAEKPVFSLEIEQYSSRLQVGGAIPRAIPDGGHFKEIERSFNKAKSALDASSLWASFTYTGVIPDSTREKIAEQKEAKHFAGGGIYLLCDAPEWKINHVPKPPEPRIWDPIVVGYAHEALWMIDVFDPTPVEQYLALEFTSVPLLAEATPTS